MEPMTNTRLDQALEPAAGWEPADPHQPAASPARTKAFRLIAGAMGGSAVAFGLFTAVFAVVSDAQEIHAFHNAVVAALLLVLSAPPAIAAARAPRDGPGPLLHLIALSLAGLVTMALGEKLDLFTMPFIVLTAVLVSLRVVSWRSLRPGRPSLVLLILVAIAAVPLISYSLDQAELQRLDHSSEHAEFNHWVETSFYATAVVLLGFVTALRSHALRLTAWSAGTALAVLGASSLLLDSYASAMASSWAWAALVGGPLFILAAEWERARLSHPSSTCQAARRGATGRPELPR